MTSLRPYLFQALIDWIADNDCTPHAVIDCAADGAEHLADYAEDGKLVLNLSARATRNLTLDDDRMSVDCRFGGRPVHVSVPVDAIIAVYARETGRGLAFGPETAADDGAASSGRESPGKPAHRGPKGKKAPVLKLVK